jgi:hypothetical protein
MKPLPEPQEHERALALLTQALHDLDRERIAPGTMERVLADVTARVAWQRGGVPAVRRLALRMMRRAYAWTGSDVPAPGPKGAWE